MACQKDLPIWEPFLFKDIRKQAKCTYGCQKHLATVVVWEQDIWQTKEIFHFMLAKSMDSFELRPLKLEV